MANSLRQINALNRSTLADIEASLEIAELHFGQVADRAWLNCQKFPVGSVFGLIYEDEATGEEILYALQLLTLTLDGQNDPSKHHCVAPHTPSFPTMKGASNIDKIKHYTNENQIVWYDLRAYPRNTQWSSKHVLRLLRNLLGVSHSASPWSSGDIHDESACAVFLFESESLADKLMHFRISDASPSWCRFGHAKLNSLPEFYKLESPSSFSNSDAQDSSASDSCSYFMFVFRHLPRRGRMSYKHPISKELPSPSGCLWETFKSKSGDSWRHRCVAPPYIDPSAEGFHSYRNLQALVEEPNISVMRNEALAFAYSLWTPWPEEAHYATNQDGGAPWKVVPLLHCFPATDPSRIQWIPHFCELCPGTVQILKQCIGESNLRTALWSRLDPDSVLEAHTGWADLANHVLRVHIPIVVPAGGVCGTWVDGCVAESSKIVIFDDSKTHRAFNYSETEERIVLIVDIVRPTELPKGTATGGHSDELDAFIHQFATAR